MGPHLRAKLRGLYVENKNGVKVVAKTLHWFYNVERVKMQKTCGKLLKDVEKVTIQFGTRLLKLFRHVLDSLERFFWELLRSEPTVCSPSLENAFSMDFHVNEAQAKFKAVSCPGLPLAAWISHLDNPLKMGLW